MKPIRSSTVLALTFFLYTSSHAGVPFSPQDVQDYVSENQLTEGSGVINISATSNEFESDFNVGIGSISLCSESACYRPPLHNRANLYNTTNGKAELLAKLVVPITKITSIHFEDSAGSKVMAGDIALRKPLELDKDLNEASYL